ncbi:MAG: response regulator [Nitrosopumilus sp.]|nr:MAG: response regulator [Nitrosopumilus sp.]
MTSVIVVDDNEDIVYSMSELLEFHGIDVIGKGYNGLDAVDLFNQLHPDVVLLDLMMPKYDGVYALKKIREIDPKSTVLIVTGGAASMSMNDKLTALKPTKILTKPFDVNVLVEMILEESKDAMPFKIQYSFNDDPCNYTCVLTYEQYKNFKKLPVVQECKIIKNDEENTEFHEQEMQMALNLASRNDVSHIQKLSQIV